MLGAHLIKLLAGLRLVRIEHGAVFAVRNGKSACRKILLCRIHHLATDNIIMLPKTRQVTMTLFIQIKEITDDLYQAAGTHGVPDALQ